MHGYFPPFWKKIWSTFFWGLFGWASWGSAQNTYPEFFHAFEQAYQKRPDSAAAIARNIPWTLPLRQKEGLSHLFLAMFFNYAEEYDSALVHLKEVEPWMESPPDWDAWFDVQDQLAIASIGKGDYPTAVKAHLDQLKRAESVPVGAERLGKIHKMLGRAHYYSKDFVHAEADFRRAIQILEGAGIQNQDLILSCQNLGAMKVEVDQADTAELLLKKSIQIRQETGKMEDPTLVMAYRLLGTLYYKTHQWVKADSMFQKAFGELNRPGLGTFRVSVMLYYSQLLRDMGRTEEGIEMAIQADSVAQAIQSPDLHISVMVHLATHYQMAGRYQEAADLFGKSHTLKDEIYSEQIAEKTAKWEAAFEKERLERSNENLTKDKALLEAQSDRDANAKRLLWVALVSLVVVGALGGMLLYFRARSRRSSEALQARIAQASALLEGEERERNRVGRELHDSIGALLSATRMHLSLLDGEVGPEQKEPFQKAMDLLSESVREVRAVSHALMPEALLRQGLFAALESTLRRLSQPGRCEISLKTSGLDSEIPPGVSVSLFRVLQELLHNSLKHGEATGIETAVRVESGSLEIRYSDNGKGFAVEEAKGKGLGLSNLFARVEMAGGQITLDSAPGGGMQARIHLIFEPWKPNVPES